MASSFDSEVETPDLEALTSLAGNVVYLLPGCSDLMVRKAFQDVYRDFCRRSCCLFGRREFDVSSSDRAVVCAPVNGGVVDCVVSVTVDGRRTLDEREYGARGGRVALPAWLPPSSGTRKVEVSFVEMPRIGSERVPPWFVQKYGEYVCAGVLARLMSQTGKAWSDPQQAQENRIRYENGVCEARMDYYAQSESGALGEAGNADGLV